MSIRTQIETIASELDTDNTFIFGLTGWQNLSADETTTFPVVFLDSPITSSDEFKQGGYVHVNYNLRMMFAQKSELDWSQVQQDTVIDQMRLLARTFVLSLKAKKGTDNAHWFRNIEGVRRTDFQNLFDVNVSGCILELTLEPFDESGVCV